MSHHFTSLLYSFLIKKELDTLSPHIVNNIFYWISREYTSFIERSIRMNSFSFTGWYELDQNLLAGNIYAKRGNWKCQHHDGAMLSVHSLLCPRAEDGLWGIVLSQRMFLSEWWTGQFRGNMGKFLMNIQN